MLNLCIDIGNTRTKAAFFEHGSLVHHYYTSIQDVLSDTKLLSSLDGLIISSSKMDIQDLEVPKHIKQVILLDHNTATPLVNLYETPETLGKDRLAAAVGAHSLYPDQLNIVIDAGTCNTYDVICKGQYLGGNISPGMRMRARAMHEFTGMLPEVDLVYHDDFIGKNTSQALENGAVLGTIFEIDSFIACIKEKYKVSDINVILTGGDADFLANHVKSKIFVNKNIVLEGLHEILKHNAH